MKALRGQPKPSTFISLLTPQPFPKFTWGIPSGPSDGPSLDLTLPSHTWLTDAAWTQPAVSTGGLTDPPIIPTMIPAINRVRRLDLKRSHRKLNKALGSSRCSGQATSALGYLRQNGTGSLATGTKKGRKPVLNRLLPLQDAGNL